MLRSRSLPARLTQWMLIWVEQKRWQRSNAVVSTHKSRLASTCSAVRWLETSLTSVYSFPQLILTARPRSSCFQVTLLNLMGSSYKISVTWSKCRRVGSNFQYSLLSGSLSSTSLWSCSNCNCLSQHLHRLPITKRSRFTTCTIESWRISKSHNRSAWTVRTYWIDRLSREPTTLRAGFYHPLKATPSSSPCNQRREKEVNSREIQCRTIRMTTQIPTQWARMKSSSN